MLEHLDRLVIKPAFAFLGRRAVFGGDLARAERDALAQRIKVQPVGFVGQERARLSTTPVWNGEKLEPRAMILRVFVAAIGDGFAVMPGGLTRTAPNDNPIISMQLGSGSKDSWVVGPTGGAIRETRGPPKHQTATNIAPPAPAPLCVAPPAANFPAGSPTGCSGSRAMPSGRTISSACCARC